MRHFFISYNKADQVWAEWIAWVLEEAGYSTIIQAWDFRPGRNFVIEMNKAAMETEQTIAIISQDYLDAEFTYPEWAAAFARDPKGENRTLIPVRVRECTTPGPLKALIYLDLMGLSEESAHEAILTALEGRGKPATSPAFPGGAVTHQAAYPPSIKVLSNIPHSRNPSSQVVRTSSSAFIKPFTLTGLPCSLSPRRFPGWGVSARLRLPLSTPTNTGTSIPALLWTRADSAESLISDYVAIASLLNLARPKGT